MVNHASRPEVAAALATAPASRAAKARPAPAALVRRGPDRRGRASARRPHRHADRARRRLGAALELDRAAHHRRDRGPVGRAGALPRAASGAPSRAHGRLLARRRRGDLAAHLSVTQRDELGELEESLDEMGRQLRMWLKGMQAESDKVRGILGP
jgi:hypothetical protein